MNWWITVPSWIVSLYFGIGFVVKAGFPPKTDLLISDMLFVGLTLFFLFLPFFNKVKIGSWIELEREVIEAKKEAAATKDELRELKNEVRLHIQHTNTVSPQFNIHMADLLRQQSEKVEEKLGEKGREKAAEVKLELQADGDLNYALAKVRIDIERLLRTIVGRSLDVQAGDTSPRFVSLSKMFDALVQGNSSYSYLREPMRYVLAVCNAAVHAQNIDAGQAQEALTLGAQIIAALKLHPNAKGYEGP